MVRNPCVGVPALPLDREEIEYLRLAEIEPYLGACADYYTPLAEFLVGTGARVSEAVATRWSDLDLDQLVVRIYRQRARASNETRATKGRRFRSVHTGTVWRHQRDPHWVLASGYARGGFLVDLSRYEHPRPRLPDAPPPLERFVRFGAWRRLAERDGVFH